MVGELGVVRALIQASTQPGEEFCSLAVVSFLVNVRQHCNANNTCSTRPAFGREVLGSALSKKIPGLRKPGAPGRSGLHTFVTGEPCGTPEGCSGAWNWFRGLSPGISSSRSTLWLNSCVSEPLISVSTNLVAGAIGGCSHAGAAWGGTIADGTLASLECGVL